MNESRIIVTLSPNTSQNIRKIAARRGVDINTIIGHALMLEYWAERADKAGDEICLKNGRTGKITIMNLPYSKPKCQTESPVPVPVKKIELRLVADNTDLESSSFCIPPNLQSVPDLKDD